MGPQNMNKLKLQSLVLVMALALISFAPARADEKPALWFYFPVNLLPKENLDRLQKVWRRAAAAGYTKVLLADSKFSRLGDLPREYFDNCRRIQQIASELHIEIIPAEFPIGYSNDILSQDPNLAEGLPVKDTPFVVHARSARCEPDVKVELNKLSFKDDVVQLDSGIATIRDNPENARLVFKLATPQFRCYHVSVSITTQGYTGQPQIVPLTGGRTLDFQNLHVQSTQDWTRCDVVFDSLDNTDVLLYFGVWGAAKGMLQWKDWRIEEVGLVNVLRRPGTPCVVKGEDGKQYVEQRDYQRIEDPRLGSVPYAGEYEAWHDPPSIRTDLPDGTRLRVSWYYPPIIYDGQVAACISEPKFNDLLANQSQRMKRLWGAKGYMMSFDEFRCFGWDLSCQDRHQTPGQMLAESLRQCTRLVSPWQAYVWSDMFDPYHNAVKGPYYLVNGPWLGSWEGLDKSVIVMNWNYGKRDESLKFFADRGNRQIICGYYDNDLSEWNTWLRSAGKVKGIVGYVYTTWRSDYDRLEEFAKRSQEKV